MRHGSEWTIALKHRWDHVEGIAPPLLRPPKRFNWFHIKLAGTDLEFLLLPLSKLPTTLAISGGVLFCWYGQRWGQRGGRLSLSERAQGEGLMTVTPVVQFVLCHDTWLSTPILIMAYTTIKVAMKWKFTLSVITLYMHILLWAIHPIMFCLKTSWPLKMTFLSVDVTTSN